MPAATDPAISVAFKVDVAGLSLGTFTGCDGLNVELSVEQYEEGGENGFVHQLPNRMRYTNLKLTRVVNADTARIADYFRALQKSFSRSTATITAVTAEGTTVWEWKLREVFPVKWTGPSFSTEGAKAATETLELAHHGFL